MFPYPDVLDEFFEGYGADSAPEIADFSFLPAFEQAGGQD